MIVSITIDASQFVAWAEEAETRLANAAPFFEQQQQWAADHLRQHMADQEGPFGPFAPLKPRYRAWKEKQVGSMPILQLTQAMLDSIVSSSDADSVTAEFTDPKAYFHQEGIDVTKRQPAWISPAAAATFTQKVADWAIQGDVGGVL